MKNRFQFRVWKGKENRMVYGVTYLNPLILDPEIDPENAHNKVMQCTGMKDKNGKLIYEGDIVKQNNTIYSVNWFNGSFCFKDTLNGKNYTVEFVMSEKQEVIGNIYENPELLESN